MQLLPLSSFWNEWWEALSLSVVSEIKLSGSKEVDSSVGSLINFKSVTWIMDDFGGRKFGKSMVTMVDFSHGSNLCLFQWCMASWRDPFLKWCGSFLKRSHSLSSRFRLLSLSHSLSSALFIRSEEIFSNLVFLIRVITSPLDTDIF